MVSWSIIKFEIMQASVHKLFNKQNSPVVTEGGLKDYRKENNNKQLTKYISTLACQIDTNQVCNRFRK